MADKIAQTMVTLAEDNRDMKISLRLLLKYEIQSLMERLSALGDDSLLILTNSCEGTCSHLGTQNGDNFLNHLKSNVHLNLKDAFQKFCSNPAGNNPERSQAELPVTTGDSQLQNQSMNQSMPQLLRQNNQSMPQMPMNNNQSFPRVPFLSQQLPFLNIQHQLKTLSSLISSPQQQVTSQNATRFSPYMNVYSGGQQNFSGNFSTEKAQDNKTTLPAGVLERKKRNACRHFISKGYCWQGHTCAFLHTRDPQILASLGVPAVVEESNQSPSSSSAESPEEPVKDPV